MLEKIGKEHNSFLAQSVADKKVLVIVPHEDDEINVGGSIMYSYVHKGADVYCAFTTNGDFSFSAATRMDEAKRALTVLGVKNIIFLGYGDTSNNYKGGHLFYAEQRPVESPSGHNETYGSDIALDYAYQKHKKHSPYCRSAFRNDIQELLLDIQPDIIFCVDLDLHSDHRAASILFEEAMGKILCRPNNMYRPTVFKGFAYCTSFGALKDFYDINIRSVLLPSPREDVIIDKSLYTWKDRVRIPVLPACRGHFLRHNILYKALFQHASQSAALHAVRIANADAVFWQRRTDNLVYQARIAGSSGDYQRVAEFNVLNIRDIDSKAISFTQYLWSPKTNDTKKTVSFHWDKNVDIAYLEIGGNVENTGRINKIEVSFSNGSKYILGPLPKAGNLLHYRLPAVQRTDACQLRILGTEGTDYGISTVGLYSCQFPENLEIPYIKIMCENEFIYDYIIPFSTRECQLSVYRYGTEEDVIYHLQENSKSQITDSGKVIFSSSDQVLYVRAELKTHPGIYDEVCIHRVTGSYIKRINFLQRIEAALLDFYLRKYRKYTHIRHKYLKQI